MYFPEESNLLMKLAIQLHRELGCGFKEKVYQDAFEVLLRENNVPYEREKHIPIDFHGVRLEHDFFYDFLCYDKIVVELKALSEINGECEAQLINYLCIGEKLLGVVFSFGATIVRYKWLVNKRLVAN